MTLFFGVYVVTLKKDGLSWLLHHLNRENGFIVFEGSGFLFQRVFSNSKLVAYYPDTFTPKNRIFVIIQKLTPLTRGYFNISLCLYANNVVIYVLFIWFSWQLIYTIFIFKNQIYNLYATYKVSYIFLYLILRNCLAVTY